MNLYTIGFSGKNAETFFDLLIKHKIRTLVDIRLNNRSQLAGFTKAQDLPWFLKTIGNIAYIHLPQLAPDAQLLKDYQNKAVDWQQYQTRFAALLITRDADALLKLQWSEWEQPACLLCSEPTAEQCHRRLIAEQLAKFCKNIEIVHL